MPKIIFWFSLFSIFALSSYILSHALMPFIISFILAYALHPIIDKMELKFHISRNIAIIIAFTIFILLLSIFLTFILPSLYQQLVILINKIPQYKTYLLTNWPQNILPEDNKLNHDIFAKINEFIHEIINGAFSAAMSLLNNIWTYTMATFNLVIVILLVPVILYFYLRDWPQIVNNLESLIPRKYQIKIRSIFIEIDNLLAAYLRGQLNICIGLSIYYSIFLALLGLDQAILLGVISGFLIIIPYIGVLTSFMVSFLICYLTFGAHIQLMQIIAIYITGHFLESVILTPKIIGNKIGLHPLWIMFAVLAFGSIFGFIGIFFAIPMAGITNILVRHSLEEYKSSKFYLIH